MEFLKRVVPPLLSGDVALDTNDEFQKSSLKLVKVKRLSLLSSDKTVDMEDGINLYHSNSDTCQHQQLGKVQLFSQV